MRPHNSTGKHSAQHSAGGIVFVGHSLDRPVGQRDLCLKQRRSRPVRKRGFLPSTCRQQSGGYGSSSRVGELERWRPVHVRRLDRTDGDAPRYWVRAEVHQSKRDPVDTDLERFRFGLRCEPRASHDSERDVAGVRGRSKCGWSRPSYDYLCHAWHVNPRHTLGPQGRSECKRHAEVDVESRYLPACPE